MGTAERGGHNLLSVPQKDGRQEMRCLVALPLQTQAFLFPANQSPHSMPSSLVKPLLMSKSNFSAAAEAAQRFCGHNPVYSRQVRKAVIGLQMARLCDTRFDGGSGVGGLSHNFWRKSGMKKGSGGEKEMAPSKGPVYVTLLVRSGMAQDSHQGYRGEEAAHTAEL